MTNQYSQSLVPYADRSFQACLFDMDGTLLTSIGSAERVWSRWLRAHDLDPVVILPTIHGVQTIETITRLGIPGIDPRAEAAWIAREEAIDLDGVRAIEGAAEFVAGLPEDGWAIVTSATRVLAEARLAAAGLTAPPLFITAEDIANGKPAPDCYIEAARRLGKDVTQCAVFEDAPAGIAAGRAAGAPVVVITATHAHPVPTEHPQIRDYRGLTTIHSDGTMRLTSSR
ncbi:HAD-IA family hydrolase [Sphingomonas sp. PvP056]|uniref:HAD-IA family hydrolase n=1 Tax=Sphingomonas sp. PvP056 TaxID=3156392 RepID=UPI0033999EAE